MKLREANISRMHKQPFDVLVIGGGINGATSAAVLAARGLKVALIERNDFASSTSQETSNLVWGGIKYMETLEFGLVRDLCVSRNHLIRKYPSTIQEIRFFVNLEKGFRWSSLALYCGALLYWFIGNCFTKAPRILSRKKIEREEPIVNTSASQGGFEYSDAYLHDNDARFVFGFVRRALDNGAIAVNYVESRGSKRDGDTWITTVNDRITGQTWDVRSSVIVNACGPYVDGQNKMSNVATDHHHLFSKGIHLLIDRVTENNRVLTFFADDGRLFFVIPMGPKSCVGTTDTRVEQLPPSVTPEDRKFVLDNINRRLNLKSPLTEKDIIAERCGVRPLVVSPKSSGQDKGDWASLSRRHAIDPDHQKKHISIFGGKLTDCLNVGEEVSALVAEMGIKMVYPNAEWYGEPPQSMRDSFFHLARLMDLDALTAPESSEPLSTRLWRRYGTSAFSLIEEIREDPGMAEVLIKGTEYTRCEIHLAAKREMIVRLDDFLRRRAKVALVERHETIAKAPGIREACKILFGNDADQKYKEYFG